MSHKPPSSTFASRQLARILPLGDAGSRRGSWALALVMAATTIAFQSMVAQQASVILLYLLLAAQSVWFLGAGTGLALTWGTILIGTIAGWGGGASPQWGMVAWNLASRLLSIGLLGFVLAGLRRTLEMERWRARTDRLTGVLNKAAFEEMLPVRIARAAARGESLVLAYMDLDGFKAVNDRHGHSAGNRVLAAFATSAEAAIRASDLFARIGGDEFAALLTVRGCVEGDRVAGLLHRRLSAVLGGCGFAVTCSMGALVMDARRMAREDDILEQADRLMYVAKDGGKNALHIGRGEASERALHAAFPTDVSLATAPGGIPARLGGDRAERQCVRRRA